MSTPAMPLDPVREKLLLLGLRQLPTLRGTFMSLNGAVQNLFSGIAAYLGGLMVAMEGGQLVGYGTVGLLAMGATLLAIGFVGRIRLHGAVPPAPTIPVPDT